MLAALVRGALPPDTCGVAPRSIFRKKMSISRCAVIYDLTLIPRL